MRRATLTALALPLLAGLAACNKPASQEAADADGNVTMVDPGETVPEPDANMSAATRLVPPAPGEPGGLPDDRTPVSEAKFTPDSPQGAASVVERYAAALEQGKLQDAFAFWGENGKATGMTPGKFFEAFGKYSEIHAQIGAPGKPEGAAGSSFVEVPLQLYGRLKDGGTFNLIGPVTLRRVNNVPGASADQLQWHIARSDLKPLGTVREVPAG